MKPILKTQEIFTSHYQFPWLIYEAIWRHTREGIEFNALQNQPRLVLEACLADDGYVNPHWCEKVEEEPDQKCKWKCPAIVRSSNNLTLFKIQGNQN